MKEQFSAATVQPIGEWALIVTTMHQFPQHFHPIWLPTCVIVVLCFLVRILEVNMAAEHTHDMKLVLTASGLDIDTFGCNLFPVFSIVRRFAAAGKLMVVFST